MCYTVTCSCLIPTFVIFVQYIMYVSKQCTTNTTCFVVIDVVVCHHVPRKDCFVVIDDVVARHLRTKDCFVVIDDVVARHLRMKDYLVVSRLEDDFGGSHVDTCHLFVIDVVRYHGRGSVDANYVFFCDGGRERLGES